MISSRAQSIIQKWGYFRGEGHIYDPETSPNGGVRFHFAENWLIRDDLQEFINSHSTFAKHELVYNEGFTGTTRLRRAMAGHINTHFSPHKPVDADELTLAGGVTTLNELCATVLCDFGKNEAIMFGVPIYGSFVPDLTLRTGVEVEFVKFGDLDQFDVGCVEVYEKALDDAEKRGVNVKALLLCNPHNPLGRCYTREAIEGILRLCEKRKIHVISDEIYALSVYDRPDRTPETFTSVLSFNTDGLIDPRRVHVLYGMSKDFGASGLRLGVLHSQNEELNKAAWTICRFYGPSQLSEAMVAAMLEDQDFVRKLVTKSRRLLLQNRLLAEKLLAQSDIKYYDEGNAGVYIWIDLSTHLPLAETNDDGWAAEALLSKRITEADVTMAYGKGFKAEKPGWFRVITGVDEATLREGIRRISKVIGKA